MPVVDRHSSGATEERREGRRAQGTGRRAQGTGRRAQGTGHMAQRQVVQVLQAEE